MGLFSKKYIEAMYSGEYICSQCGKKMVFETEWRDVLVCESCGHSVDLDDYGFEEGEEEDNRYPRLEDLDDDE